MNIPSGCVSVEYRYIVSPDNLIEEVVLTVLGITPHVDRRERTMPHSYRDQRFLVTISGIV